MVHWLTSPVDCLGSHPHDLSCHGIWGVLVSCCGHHGELVLYEVGAAQEKETSAITVILNVFLFLGFTLDIYDCSFSLQNNAGCYFFSDRLQKKVLTSSPNCRVSSCSVTIRLFTQRVFIFITTIVHGKLLQLSQLVHHARQVPHKH